MEDKRNRVPPRPASARAVFTATRSHTLRFQRLQSPSNASGPIKCLLRENSNTPPGHEFGAVPPSFKAAPLRKQRAQTCGEGPQYPGYPGDPDQPGVRRAGGPPQARPRWAAGAGAAPHFGSSDWSQCSVCFPQAATHCRSHTCAGTGQTRPSPESSPSTKWRQKWNRGAVPASHTAVPRPP